MTCWYARLLLVVDPSLRSRSLVHWRGRERSDFKKSRKPSSQRFCFVFFSFSILSFSRINGLENNSTCRCFFFRDYLPAKSTRCTLETVSDGMLPSERPACTKVIVKIAWLLLLTSFIFVLAVVLCVLPLTMHSWNKNNNLLILWLSIARRYVLLHIIYYYKYYLSYVLFYKNISLFILK